MKRKLKCVLLVDDSEPTNFVNKKIVEKMELAERVETVENGFEALEFLKKESDKEGYPELIFLDINMPGMNGWEFLDAYAKLPKKEQALLVIVMLTTSLNPDDREKAIRIGYVEDFINKPLTKDKVQEVYETFFKHKI